LLYEAIRKNKGQLKCSVFLSAAEYTNKAETYREARRWGLQIEDKGDLMIVKNPKRSGLIPEIMIWLDRTEDQVRQEILKVSGTRTPPPPQAPRNTQK
jgi:hypothetical protein